MDCAVKPVVGERYTRSRQAAPAGTAPPLRTTQVTVNESPNRAELVEALTLVTVRSAAETMVPLVLMKVLLVSTVSNHSRGLSAITIK